MSLVIYGDGGWQQMQNFRTIGLSPKLPQLGQKTQGHVNMLQNSNILNHKTEKCEKHLTVWLIIDQTV